MGFSFPVVFCYSRRVRSSGDAPTVLLRRLVLVLGDNDLADAGPGFQIRLRFHGCSPFAFE